MKRKRQRQPGLLVSVRSAAEAAAALAGGADLIDVKEPGRGALGQAEDAVIAAVLRCAAGKRPVSAALGDLPPTDLPHIPDPAPPYLKWGFAGWGNESASQWHAHQRAARASLTARAPSSRMVVVAYADWQRANAPSPTALWKSRRANSFDVFLIDTFIKDGTTLLDWLDVLQLAKLCRACRNDGVAIALAGSLGLDEITVLQHLQPDWFAVRGAACRGGREGIIDAERIRGLKELLTAPAAILGS